jgi:pSer/pThr/pTyr-binding forkhead associated (FHA) protein
MPTLDDLEFRLQTLLEVQMLKYVPGYKSEDRIFQYLAAAMHTNLREQDGITFAPNLYVIKVEPSALAEWQHQPSLVKQLEDALQSTGEEAGFHFFANTIVTFEMDTEIGDHENKVIATFSSESISETRGMPTKTRTGFSVDPFPQNAFLILSGTKIIPLNLPVINLGRRLDNQVVIDDPRVSRTHAQIRVTRGHYALFDLNSNGGTFVNGQRTNMSILNPGDVISLAGVNLVFGQELPAEQSTEKVSTQPNSTISHGLPPEDLIQANKHHLDDSNKR